MKLVKELPKSIYYSIYYRLKQAKRLTKNKNNIPVLVSLTSIPSRLPTLDIVIKSLLNQSVLPEKIILWLHTDLKNKLPRKLNILQSDLFEIKYSKLTCSHRKLIHTLEENPTNIIVTCDDDLIYNINWLKNIYNEHIQYPNSIIANKATQIKMDEDNNYKPFIHWRKKEESNLKNYLLPIGAWGILYPPNAMSKTIFDENLFLKLAPKADDLWFKSMSLLNNTISREAVHKTREPIPIIGSQKESLKKENVKLNKNEIQWNALSNHFNLKAILLND